MKRNFYLLILLLLVGQSAFAQRYLTPVFSNVKVDTSLIYAVNATVLTCQSAAAGNQVLNLPLQFDLYSPEADTAQLRPLVIYLKTGNFLPNIINGGISGTRRDSATVEISKRLAKMGYVVASVDYRLGWNPLAATQPERSFQLINAAYRGVQDARTAIRYFKKTVAEAGNPYKIDTTRVVLWGQGTGGYISLAAATLDEYIEIATTCQPAGKFLIDLDGPGPQPSIPMVIPQVNGDIYGTSLGVFPGVAGVNCPAAGDTLNIPNHVGYGSNFQMSVNMGGALGDICWLDQGEVPMVSFHCPKDPFAPYNSGILNVPTAADPLPVVEVQGSYGVMHKVDSLGNNNAWKTAPLVTSSPYTNAAVLASVAAGHEYEEGLYPLNRPTTPFNTEEGSPWDYWDAAYWSQICHPGCDPDPSTPYSCPEQLAMCNFHVVGLLNNPDMSREKAHRYIDTIVGYFAPRAFVTLNLSALNTQDLLNDEFVNVSIFPNPATDAVSINVDYAHPLIGIELYDVNGRMVYVNRNINAPAYQLPRQSLPTGMYMAKLQFKEGILSKRIMFE